MKLEIYQKNAIRTCVDLGSLQLNLSHMCLGMLSEINELSSALENEDPVNVSEELADIMWYVANYCTYRDITLTYLPASVVSDLVDDISKLSDLVKKYLAYGKEINRQQELACIVNIVLGVQSYFNGLDIELEEALENNINKLKVRYPDKFSQEKALNRNLELERAELEKNF